MRFKAFDGDRELDVEIEPLDGGYAVTIDGQRREIDAAKLEGSHYSLIVDHRSYDVSVTAGEGGTYTVRHSGRQRSVRLVDPLVAAAGAHLDRSGPAPITAVMPGRVVKVMVEEGQEVAEGQGLIILEAMKMENEVEAPRAGRVTTLKVTPGQNLESGELIALIE
ncbi:MAG: biotin/lipoyl-containing protein [Acidobacteriota bacterium]|nr:biotin/lipoyl-containing protein [Acidobacteriota bacterium]